MRTLRVRRGSSGRIALPHPLLWAFAAAIVGVLAVLVASSVPIPLAPGVAVPALEDTPRSISAAVLGLVAIVSVRRALYDRLARRPGPVEVTSFEGAPSPDDPLTKEDVLAEFRRTLTTMTLSVTEPVPNAPADDSILDDAKTSLDGGGNPAASALRLAVSLIRVRHAYRVSVQLRRPERPGRCGLAVHVVRMPSGVGEVVTVWDNDWEAAARRAAHVVGAFVVPRSRLSRRSPWTAWHGYEMPHELFHHNQQASTYIRERRYEQALRALHDALTIDPQNPSLRIQLGQVQELLGLYLDATATFADLVAVESWYDRRLWLRLRKLLGDDTTGPPPPTVQRRPNGRDALMIGRYRLVTRLTGTEQIVDQWFREPRTTDSDGTTRAIRNDRRAAERKALRARMLVWLRSYVLEYADDCANVVAAVAGPDWIHPQAYLDLVAERNFLSTNHHPRRVPLDRRRLALRHLLQYVAKREADALIDDYRWSRGRRRPGMPVSQTGMNVMRIGAELYLELAEVATLGDSSTHHGFPDDPQSLDLRITRYLALKPSWARGWIEHYNAACVVSVALRDRRGTLAQQQRRQARLAFQAVRHLERAVHSADSGYVGRVSQWLISGDPDLIPLRSTSQFVDFLDRYIPGSGPRVPRPTATLHEFLMTCHALRMLVAYCDLRARFWAQYRTTPSSTPEFPTQEENREGDAIKRVAVYAEENRHWQTRLALILEAKSFAAEHGLDLEIGSFPEFHEDLVVRALARSEEDLSGGAGASLTPISARPIDVIATAVIAIRRDCWREVLQSTDEAPESDPSQQPGERYYLFWRALAEHIEARLRRDGSSVTLGGTQ